MMASKNQMFRSERPFRSRSDAMLRAMKATTRVLWKRQKTDSSRLDELNAIRMLYCLQNWNYQKLLLNLSNTAMNWIVEVHEELA